MDDFRAPGPLRADSSENFSTERPVFVASPAPMSRKLGTEDFLLKVWRIPRCSFSRSRVLISSINNNRGGTLEFAKRSAKNLPYQVFETRRSGDATKTGRSVLKFSVECARSGPGARKSPKNGEPENQQRGYTSFYYCNNTLIFQN